MHLIIWGAAGSAVNIGVTSAKIENLSYLYNKYWTE